MNECMMGISFNEMNSFKHEIYRRRQIPFHVNIFKLY